MKLSVSWMQLDKKVEGIKTINNSEQSKSPKIKDNMKSFPAEDEECYLRNDDESKQVKEGEATKLLLSDNVEELKLKISALNSELSKVIIYHTVPKFWGLYML